MSRPTTAVTINSGLNRTPLRRLPHHEDAVKNPALRSGLFPQVVVFPQVVEVMRSLTPKKTSEITPERTLTEGLHDALENNPRQEKTPPPVAAVLDVSALSTQETLLLLPKVLLPAGVGAK